MENKTAKEPGACIGAFFIRIYCFGLIWLVDPVFTKPKKGRVRHGFLFLLPWFLSPDLLCIIHYVHLFVRVASSIAPQDLRLVADLFSKGRRKAPGASLARLEHGFGGWHLLRHLLHLWPMPNPPAGHPYFRPGEGVSSRGNNCSDGINCLVNTKWSNLCSWADSLLHNGHNGGF